MIGNSAKTFSEFTALGIVVWKKRNVHQVKFYILLLYIYFDRNIKKTFTIQTCWPLLPPPTSPVLRGEVVDAAPLLIPGVVVVGMVVALLSGGKNPVADIGTTSKNCFWNKRRKKWKCQYLFSLLVKEDVGLNSQNYCNTVTAVNVVDTCALITAQK